MTPAAAVELVRTLSPLAKEAVLVELLNEVIRENDSDGGVIPITTPDGLLGIFYPPKALALQYEEDGPKLTPERETEIQRRIDHPGKMWTLEEMLKSLEEEDAALEKAAAQRESA